LASVGLAPHRSHFGPRSRFTRSRSLGGSLSRLDGDGRTRQPLGTCREQ
jgi:hypothetical protein